MKLDASKLKSLIGIVVGIVIIILSITVFARDVDMSKPEMDDISYSTITAPEEEDNEWYGGDAYTGMQQAAAQAANNLIPVFEAVNQGTRAVITVNDNMQAAARADANNLGKAVAAMQYCFGMLLLSIGLLTVAKNLGLLLEGVKFKTSRTAENDAPASDFADAENEMAEEVLSVEEAPAAEETPV